MNLDLAVDLCRTFEGFSARPYTCPAGVPTIGYGTTTYEDGTKVTLADPSITKARAEGLLRLQLRNVYAPGVARLCPALFTDAVATNRWERFCAITDFAYNLGIGALQTSTLRRKINEGDWAGAKEQIMRWVRARGAVLPGLVKRRKAEAILL